jgi:predicted DsbA family dithiol-disulfide isomerase
MAPLKVEIWSDVVCPWCHVGLARFEEAVRRLGWDEADLEVVYRPFELDPTVPPGGVDLVAYLQRKFGPSATVRSIEGRVGEAGEEVGIRFEWTGVRRVNTFDAHRLVEWALATAGPRVQVQLERRLMRAYFEEVGDVASHASLADHAAEVGLDRDDALAVLASDRFSEEVRASEQEARELDIHAVPTFVIERRLAIPGAQDPETFVSMLARVRNRLDQEAEDAALFTAGQACAADDPNC